MPIPTAPYLKRLTCWGLLGLFAVAGTSEAKKIRVATFNVLQGVEAPGTTEYNAIRDILTRVDADVIAFQELKTATLGNWQALAAELGYSNSPYSASTTFAGGLYVGYFSRWPILSTHNVLSTPPANEISRPPFRAVIDVPATASPLVLWTIHLKALSGANNEFRRAIEGLRAGEDIDAYIAANPTHTDYVVLGDFNADVGSTQTTTFNSLPSGLPTSYSLGTDITFPVPYAVFPRDAFEIAGDGMVMLDAFHEDSANRNTFITSSGRLDYLFASSPLASNAQGVAAAEVYNSVQDDGIGGLPKAGSPLPAGTSAAASDHYLVFADLYMADATSLSLTPADGISLEGIQGASFAPTNWTYILSNSSPASVDWTLDLPVWLETAETSNTLAAGVATSLVLTVKEMVATTLVHGIYADTVTVNDTGSGAQLIRSATLTLHPRFLLSVSPTGPLQIIGPEGGPFSPASRTYQVINEGAFPLPWECATTVPWLSVSPSSGLLSPFSTVDVVVAIGNGIENLTSGVYGADVLFSNRVDGAGSTNREVTLTVLPPAGFAETVEFGAPGWVADGLWHIADTATSLCARAYEGTRSWWFGSETTCTYNTGATTSGTLTSPALVVPPNGVLGFWSWEETESPGTTYDRRKLFITTDEGATSNLIFQSTNNNAVWHYVALDLSAYTGTAIRLIFSFDTEDNIGNDFSGWFIDDLTVFTPGDLDATVSSPRWEGQEGGPFTLADGSASFVLSNASEAVSVPWDLVGVPPWLSAPILQGELVPGDTVSLTLHTNSLTSLFAGGLYTQNVLVVNRVFPADSIQVPVSLLVRDALPDLWRLVYFGHIEPNPADLSRATDDADGDGDDNLTEYIADTHPRDSNVVWRVDQVEVASPFAVRWVASPNRVYDVEYTDTLFPAAWTGLYTNLTGVAGTMGVQDPTDVPARLYRVQVRIP